MDPASAAHIAATALWAGALIALLAAPLSPPVRRAGYRFVAAPAFFVAALSGIAVLHREPSLLRAPWTYAVVALVAGLMVVDQLAWRRVRG